MKSILISFLLLVSTSLMADPPECTRIPGDCKDWNPRDTRGQIASVHEPGTLALIGLGLVGIAVVQKRKS